MLSKTNKKKYLLSVIIPAFNVEKELNDLLLILNRLKKENIEIIIIDDGSTDGTFKMLVNYIDNLSDQNGWILKHQNNKGLSAGRNTGLCSASGEFIWFVDSDDLINVEAFNYLYNYIDKNREIDLALFNYQTFINEREIINFKNKLPSSYYSDLSCQKLMESLFKRNIQNYSWSFIAKAELYFKNNIFFPEGRNFEDYATTYKVFSVAKNIIVSNDVVYFYRNRVNSIVNNSSKNQDNALDILETSNEILNKYSSSKNSLARQFVLSFLLYAFNSLPNSSDSKKLKSAIDSKIRAMDLYGFPIKKKIVMFLYEIGVYQLVKSVKRISWKK